MTKRKHHCVVPIVIFYTPQCLLNNHLEMEIPEVFREDSDLHRCYAFQQRYCGSHAKDLRPLSPPSCTVFFQICPVFILRL